LKKASQKGAQADGAPLSEIKRAEKDDMHPFPGRIEGSREIDHGWRV